MGTGFGGAIGATAKIRASSSTYLTRITFPAVQRSITTIEDRAAIDAQLRTRFGSTTTFIVFTAPTAGLRIRTTAAINRLPTLIRNPTALSIQLQAGFGNTPLGSARIGTSTATKLPRRTSAAFHFVATTIGNRTTGGPDLHTAFRLTRDRRRSFRQYLRFPRSIEQLIAAPFPYARVFVVRWLAFSSTSKEGQKKRCNQRDINSLAVPPAAPEKAEPPPPRIGPQFPIFGHRLTFFPRCCRHPPGIPRNPE